MTVYRGPLPSLWVSRPSRCRTPFRPSGILGEAQRLEVREGPGRLEVSYAMLMVNRERLEGLPAQDGVDALISESARHASADSWNRCAGADGPRASGARRRAHPVQSSPGIPSSTAAAE